MNARALVDRHVRRFNEGVRTGDFAPMLERFDENATLRFEGVSAGPYVGRAAIADAYRTSPPDDEIEIRSVEERDGRIAAIYSWRRDGGRPSGEMIFTTTDDGRITGLTVTFDPQDS